MKYPKLWMETSSHAGRELFRFGMGDDLVLGCTRRLQRDARSGSVIMYPEVDGNKLHLCMVADAPSRRMTFHETISQKVTIGEYSLPSNINGVSAFVLS